MKKPMFWEGVVIALLASSIGVIGFFAATLLLSGECAIRLLINALALAYGVYLLGRSRERLGRITVLVSWCLVSIVAWLFNPPLELFLIVQVLAIWLIRSLYFYGSLFLSLADLGLSLFATASALWALDRTGSLFLSIWCFFLIQALFVVIAAGNRQSQKGSVNPPDSEDQFKRAYQAAEAAVHKLSTNK